MTKCFICGNEIASDEKLLVVYCKCPHCNSYAYEKSFMTAFDFYFSFNLQKKQKMLAFLNDYVPKHKVCFVDDADTSLVEGYELKEFRDILNMVGMELIHNNTIDSNWKD